ncbi:MAG: MFS transporter, partial [Treponema sp.]|nr:MFS transporter [Treponema sp.]
LGTREQENLPDPEKMTLKMWLSVFKNKAYRNFLGIFLPFQITVDLVLALFIFYIDIVILQYRNYELVVGLLLVCSMLFVPVMGAIAQRKGKAFPMYIGVPIWMLSTLTFIWLGSGVPVVVLCVLAVLIATGTSSGQLATWSMLTDIFDIDELCTGKRREGVYSGMTTFLRKFGSGVAILLIGFGLKAFGFDQNEYTVQKALMVNFNPTEYAKSNVVFGIKWMFVVIPIVLLAICLVFVIRNKINKRRFDSVLKGISEFKAHGNISGLTEKEANDVVIATGVASEKLWGGGQLS